MKKSYAVSLAVIVILLTVTLSLTTSYGLWKITNKDDKIVTNLNGCFEVIYPSNDTIKNTKYKPLNDENGKATDPYSLSIKNICKTEKKVEVRLNINEENTINVKGLTVYVQGDVDLEPIKYTELQNSRANMEGLSNSKKITTINIEPGLTARLNIKLWFDEKVISNISDDSYLDASFDITDKESIILPTFKETILANNGEESNILNRQKPNFAYISTISEGLFTAEDEDGTSFYFRGNTPNNYMTFANHLWRTVRINGDETVRLILEDTLTESEFNETNTEKYHAGYTYKEDNQLKNSTMKNYLDSWYTKNLKKYDNYVAISVFCNDTDNYINNWHNYFKASARLIGDKIPSLVCDASEEEFGGIYRGRIGLITADEAVLAGAGFTLSNSEYYLNNGTEYFTMTPRDFYYSTSMFVIKSNGSLEQTLTNNKAGVRPVISLKANTVVLGDGTKENPYRIDEDANK